MRLNLPLKKIAMFALFVLAINVVKAQSDIVITEIMYNPPESGTDSLEFIEMYNNTANPIDMTGYEMVGVTFTFPTYTLNPGAYVVVAVDSMAMVNTFGYIGALEWTSGGLSNGGEGVALMNGTAVVDTVRYDDGGAFIDQDADGWGRSIVLCDMSLDNNDGANWYESTTNSGIILNTYALYASPGAEDAICACLTDAIDPVAICQDTTVYLNASGEFTIDGTFVDNGSNDNCSASPSLTVSTTTFTCANIGANNVNLTVEDDNSNTATCPAVVTVLDTLAPVVSCMDSTIYVDATGVVTATPAMVDNNSTDNCNISNLTINNMPSISYTCSDLGANNVRLYVTDLSGNIDSCDAVITVVDTIRPVPDMANLADINANCKLESLTDPTATDNCSGTVTVSHDATLPITTLGTTVVTWTYEDENGNTFTQTQNVIITNDLTVTGTTSDEISGNDGGVNITVNGGTSPYDYDWDNSETTEDLTNVAAGTYVVTVTDVNGCEATESFVVDSQLGVDDEALNLSIYPNPANSSFFVKSNQIGGEIAIYGIDGKLAMNKVIITSNNQEVKLNNLNTGVYFVKVTNNDLQKTVRLIVR